MFGAFAQYTAPVLLQHLPPEDSLAVRVKLMYVTGITVGFLLQIVPIFFHFDRLIPEIEQLRHYETSSSYVFRGLVTLSACIIGYNAGHFVTFLNLQGAIFGTLISYILPAMFFLTMLSDAKIKRQRKTNTDQMELASCSEYGVNFEPQESTERTLR